MDLRTISATYYNVKNYGATGNGSTDDTAAIQSAINACHTAGGGIVYFPNGIYLIGGALQTSVSGDNPQCQIYIPLSQSSTTMTRIKFMGEAPPNWNDEVIGTSVKNTYGVILNSTLVDPAGSRAAVIGTPVYASPNGNFNYTIADFENLMVRVKTVTGTTQHTNSISGIHGGYLVGATFRNVKVESSSALTSQIAPTAGCGIVLPYIQNKAVCILDNCFVCGFYDAYQISEHTVGNYVVAIGCINGIRVKDAHHGITINQTAIEGCANNIVMDQTTTAAKVQINGFYVEKLGSNWWAFQKDISFAQNRGRVNILHYNGVVSGVGSDYGFVTDQPSKVKIENNYDIAVSDHFQTLTDGATITFDLYKGKKGKVTLGGNRTLSITNAQEGKVVLKVTQDGTGSRTLSLPGSSSVTLSTGAGAIDILEGEYDGTTWYWSKKGSY